MSSKNKETAPKEEQPIEETPVEEAPEAMVEEVSETDALRAELESAQNDLAAEKDKNLRLRAEYDNFRKRSARERDNIYADVKADGRIRTLDDPDSTRYADVRLSKTTIVRLDDWTWLATIGMVANVHLVEETPEA